ncbi:MAG: tryptophan synthase subunit alpha [Myxococcota bacterium]
MTLGRLLERIDASRESSTPLLMCAIVAGDPFLEATSEHMGVVAEHGADIIELIHPFSAPSFHGPVIQRSSMRARREGVTLEELAEQIEEFRAEYDTPVVVSSYINRLMTQGFARAAEVLAGAGADGVALTDVPWAQSAPFRQALRDAGLAFVPAAGPTTTLERYRLMEDEGVPVALWTGHVGSKIGEVQELLALLEQDARAHPSIALIASMQVSTAAEARTVTDRAAGVLIGSALAWIIEGRGADLHERLGAFVKEVREAIG